MAIASGNEDTIKEATKFCHTLSRKPQLHDMSRWENKRALAWIPIDKKQIVPIKCDGHCLFAALWCARWRGKHKTSFPSVVARRSWVKRARQLLASNTMLGDLSATDLILDAGQTVESYLDLMSKEDNPDRAAWGGEKEIFAIAMAWKCRICVMIHRTDKQEGSEVRVVQGPVGDGQEVYCLLYNGTHYDLLLLTHEQLHMLGLWGSPVPGGSRIPARAHRFRGHQ